MLAERVKEEREKSGKTLRALCEDASMSLAYLSQIESGKSTEPSYRILKGLSRALDVSIEYLIGEVDAIPKPMCETCLFFVTEDAEYPNHYCHRYPPQIFLKKTESDLDHRLNPIYEDFTYSEFPEVRSVDWCGEWRQR